MAPQYIEFLLCILYAELFLPIVTLNFLLNLSCLKDTLIFGI